MLPYGRHDINEEDIQAVVDVLRGDWLTTGPAVERFEHDLAEFIGGVPVIAVSSGTAALHSAYVAAGLGPGDEVITPPITFVATQAALVQVGATPVFADVQPDTANIDPAAVLAAISPKTVAIVAVDFAGHPADMDELRAIADRHSLLLIEDASHSLGSNYRGRPVGSLADITTFSFFPTKNIAAGEGGAVVAKDATILDRARRFSRQGLVRSSAEHRYKDEGPWHQEVHEFGLNYRLSDLHAALGASQLKRIGHFKSVRKQIWEAYNSALGELNDVVLPTRRPDTDPMWHLYALRVPHEVRRETFIHLRKFGIGVQVNYWPSHLHPAFKDLIGSNEALPVARSFYDSEISLPLYTSLSPQSMDFVVKATQKAYALSCASSILRGQAGGGTS